MTTTTSRSSKKSSTAVSQEATAMLRADHQHVSDLFEQFERARVHSRKEELVAEICNELTVHAQIEEEILYPAAKRVLKEKALISEAMVEHASLKDLIAQIEDASADEALYDAKVTVLAEYVKHHVKEEEGEMFPKLRASSLDLKSLGEQMAARKQALMEELA